MWRAKYEEDRIEERRGQRAEVAGKVEAIVSQPVQTFRIPPFIGEDPYIPLDVAVSVVRRHSELWGKYETLPLTKKQLTGQKRRIPLG